MGIIWHHINGSFSLRQTHASNFCRNLCFLQLSVTVTYRGSLAFWNFTMEFLFYSSFFSSFLWSENLDTRWCPPAAITALAGIADWGPLWPPTICWSFSFLSIGQLAIPVGRRVMVAVGRSFSEQRTMMNETRYLETLKWQLARWLSQWIATDRRGDEPTLIENIVTADFSSRMFQADRSRYLSGHVHLFSLSFTRSKNEARKSLFAL